MCPRRLAAANLRRQFTDIPGQVCYRSLRVRGQLSTISSHDDGDT
eukprot:SAG11_NODE_3470_length_2429_cov_3.351073_3_plen_45_part_00